MSELLWKYQPRTFGFLNLFNYFKISMELFDNFWNFVKANLNWWFVRGNLCSILLLWQSLSVKFTNNKWSKVGGYVLGWHSNVSWHHYLQSAVQKTVMHLNLSNCNIGLEHRQLIRSCLWLEWQISIKNDEMKQW